MTQLYKYPKTMHLPWSPGLQNDDRLIQTLGFLEKTEVVVTEKMDGENTSMYANTIHARSVDGRHHPSRDWVKGFHGQISHLISPDDRICGENVYAKHSIGYDNLESYFYGFGVWTNTYCWNWDETLEIFDIIGVVPVPTLFRGSWDEFMTAKDHFDLDGKEGYVVRTTQAFDMSMFQYMVAKYVRKNHVQTDEHWMSGPITPNKIRTN